MKWRATRWGWFNTNQPPDNHGYLGIKGRFQPEASRSNLSGASHTQKSSYHLAEMVERSCIRWPNSYGLIPLYNGTWIMNEADGCCFSYLKMADVICQAKSSTITYQIRYQEEKFRRHRDGKLSMANRLRWSKLYVVATCRMFCHEMSWPSRFPG